ncbi:MAG: endonuclease/exonuclease/phosphatase family protein [Chlorobiaceae bacterium]|nr:endonuclease/exonuclease/phosphatase family protein [Chlorobiaceae bacterium]
MKRHKALLLLLLFMLPPLHCSISATDNPRKTPPSGINASKSNDTGSGKKLLILWWNVENLFDAVDDPATADDDFTPSGRLHWTPKKLFLKQMRLRHVITAVRASPDYGKYPDLLAFAESENRRTFEDTLSPLDGIRYKTLYYESSDPRGIDIGIAYDPQSLLFRSIKAYTVPSAREIIVAGFSAEGRSFHVIVNHWPSRSFDTEWSEPKRIAAAIVCRHIADSLMQRNPKEKLIIMGDFNDGPENRSVKEVLRSSFDVRKVIAEQHISLFNCWSGSRQNGSFRFKTRWQRIDQMLLSAAMLEHSGIWFPADGFRCFSFFRMLDPLTGKPWPTCEKNRYLGGYSDHLPLVLKLEVDNRR